MQTRYHGHRSVPIYQTFRSGPYTASLKTGYLNGPHREVGLLHRLAEYISGLSIPVASFLVEIFPWCKHGTMAIGPSQFTQTFCSVPYTASLETGYFDIPHRLVGLWHRLSEYISDLSISVASFWYKYFLGTKTVPWSQVRTNLPNFPFWALYCLPQDGVFERPAQVSGVVPPTGGIHFWSLHTRSFLLV